MSGQTPGQAAYEAWLPLAYDTCDGNPWDQCHPGAREAWEAAAQAAIRAQARAWFGHCHHCDPGCDIRHTVPCPDGCNNLDGAAQAVTTASDDSTIAAQSDA